MNVFLKLMPKVELHAHLNGSLNQSSIRELGTALYGENTKEFLLLSKKFIEFNANSELDECFLKFKFMHELTSTKKGLEMATRFIVRDFALDHVVHLELRTTPKANDEMTKREYLEVVLDAIGAATTDNTEISVKLLPSIDRCQSVTANAETLDAVFSLQRLHPAIITGIDFSGNPNCGNFRDFVPLLQKARQNGLKLALHCAEIDNPTEVVEMLEFGMERCGHGTFLTAAQVQELGERQIAIECCLTSNVKCGTVRNYNDHHFKRIFDVKQKCPAPVVLCTDDAGVFDSNLSNELQLAAKTFDLRKQDFYYLSMNAVEHAFASDLEKQTMRECIGRYFEEH